MSKVSKSVVANKVSDAPDFGYTSEIYKVVADGSKFRLINTAGEVVDRPDNMNYSMRKTAGEQGRAIRGYKGKNGKSSYRMVDIEEYNMMVAPLPEQGVVTVEEPKSHDEVLRVIHTESLALKPKELIVKDLKWKYLVRSAVRGKNIMMTGPSGTGKTMAARQLVKQLSKQEHRKEVVTAEQLEALRNDGRVTNLKVRSV